MKPKIPTTATGAEARALEAAARWSETLRDAGDDPEVRAAFDAWRQRSPGHADAFGRVELAQALARSVADAPEIHALRRETMARVAARRARTPRWPRRIAVAACLAAVAVLGVATIRPQAYRQFYGDVRDAVAGNVYRTQIGQRTVVRLDDGSVVTLNTDSRVSVHYAPQRRDVTLERGQALFQVAKDAARPFVVSAGGRKVTALGTRFDVLMSEGALEVTLLEGRVVVTPAPGDGRAGAAELRSGQQFVASRQAPPQVRPTDVKRVVSWLQGQLVFENERLADAVAEMNRYSRRKIAIGDPQLASLRLSGAFAAGDTAAFVGALTDYFPIEKAEDGGDAVVLRSRAASAPAPGGRRE